MKAYNCQIAVKYCFAEMNYKTPLFWKTRSETILFPRNKKIIKREDSDSSGFNLVVLIKATDVRALNSSGNRM